MPVKAKKIKKRHRESGSGALSIPALPYWAAPAAVAGAGSFILAVLAGKGASPAFLFLIGALIALCCLIGYDIIGRRSWERDMAQKLKNLTINHDRLVRETARNRSDVAILKEGLADMASSMEQQGRRLLPSSTAEARMIETMVQHIGMLGERPRAHIGTTHDAPLLELELSPPPQRPLPLTPLDAALETDFNAYTDSMVKDMIHHAVRHDGIDVYVQPVVNLPQRKVRFYETFARLRAGNGVIIPASRYMNLAAQEQMIPAIDNLLLLRCLHLLREHRGNSEAVPCVINVAAATLNDRGFMNDLVAFLSQHRRLAAQLVFEMPQEEIEAMDGPMLQVLDGLSKLGCRFSMDRVRRRQINVNVLKSRHIRFIKMDASWIIKEGRDKTGFSRIARFKKQLDAAGIDLIVEKIENENMVRELLDYNISFGQGFLFGKPDIWTTYNDNRKVA